ncbi:MAG: hypothetical protein KBS58_03590 [Bacteroidales bacterium]|nr:hypothetical protein [Candidatus Cacconaster equi]
MNDFSEKENSCRDIFECLGPCWHLWSPENFEVIFRNEEDYKFGMSIFAICAKMCSGVMVLTFEIMSNHIHVCMVGEWSEVSEFIDMLKKFLERHFKRVGYTINWQVFEIRSRALETLDDIRNVIIYDNRNGYVVHPEYSPFTYPWGANKYFFNPDCCRYTASCSKEMTVREKRMFMHSRIGESVVGLKMADGYANPMTFCNIGLAEKLFRDAGNYFYKLGKSVEANRQISKELGESIYYTDDELFAAISHICKKRFGNGLPSVIPANAKIELARTMRYEYNASPKQIQRILRIDTGLISQL